MVGASVVVAFVVVDASVVASVVVAASVVPKIQ